MWSSLYSSVARIQGVYALKSFVRKGQTEVEFDFAVGSLHQDSGLDFQVLDLYEVDGRGDADRRRADDEEESEKFENDPWNFSLKTVYLSGENDPPIAFFAGLSNYSPVTYKEALNRLLVEWFRPKNDNEEHGRKADCQREFQYLLAKPDLTYSVETFKETEAAPEGSEPSDPVGGGENRGGQPTSQLKFHLVLPPGFKFQTPYKSILELLKLDYPPDGEEFTYYEKRELGVAQWAIANNSSTATLKHSSRTPIVGFSLDLQDPSNPVPVIAEGEAQPEGEEQDEEAPGRSVEESLILNAYGFEFKPLSMDRLSTVVVQGSEGANGKPDSEAAVEVLSKTLASLLENGNLSPLLLTAEKDSDEPETQVLLRSSNVWRTNEDPSYRIPLVLELGWNDSAARAFNLSKQKRNVVFHFGEYAQTPAMLKVKNYVAEHRVSLGQRSLAGRKRSGSSGRERTSGPRVNSKRTARGSIMEELCPGLLVTTVGSRAFDYVQGGGFAHVLAYMDERRSIRAGSYFSARQGQDKIVVRFLNSGFQTHAFSRQAVLALVLRVAPRPGPGMASYVSPAPVF